MESLIKGKWCIYKKNNGDWVNILKEYPEANFLNDIEWANHLENFGWKTLRLIKIKNNFQDSKTLTQAFIKYLPLSTAIVWIPGGIIGDYDNLNGLQKEIKEILNVKFCFIRIRFPQYYDLYKEIELLKNNWQRPVVSLNTRFRVLLNLNNSIENIKNKFSRNWKRSLKKSYQNNLKIIEISSYKTVSKIYREMKLNKGLMERDIFSEKQCKSIIKAYGKNLLIFAAKDKFSKICSIRGVIIRQGKLYDIFSASNKYGRLYSASHLVIYSIFEKAIQEGFLEYDLSSIDPEKSLGVYNFKKGTGGNIIHTLGEFEWTNFFALKLLINLYCKLK